MWSWGIRQCNYITLKKGPGESDTLAKVLGRTGNLFKGLERDDDLYKGLRRIREPLKGSKEGKWTLIKVPERPEHH